MRDIRRKLYNTAERFDTFLDDVLRRISPKTKTVLVLIIGGMAAVAAVAGKYLWACMLLGCGTALWLSR
jgi:hypothetical protein